MNDGLNVYDYGAVPDTSALPGVPARITAQHKDRYEIVCPRGITFARLKAGEYYAGGETFPTVGDYVTVDYIENGDSFTGPIHHDGDTLDRLIWAHISTVPFESLDLHEYGIVPSLNIDDLFDKFVVRRRGGYCFEQNTIFGQLLSDLGFPTYATVVRLLGRPGPLFPYSHKGLVAEAGGKNWYCDVGYGGPGPKGAVEIRDGEQVVGGVTYRGTTRPNDFLIERQTDDGWINVLYFAQRPIEPCDFEPLNYYCAMRPDSNFRLNRTVNRSGWSFQ